MGQFPLPQSRHRPWDCHETGAGRRGRQEGDASPSPRACPPQRAQCLVGTAGASAAERVPRHHSKLLMNVFPAPPLMASSRLFMR